MSIERKELINFKNQSIMKKTTDRPRFQEIKYNAKGQPFVTHYGQRHYLNEFMTAHGMEHNGRPVHGVKACSAFMAYAVELSECGDGAKVFTIS